MKLKITEFTVVLEELVLKELRKITTYIREHKDDFIELAIQNSAQKQSAELKAAKKRLAQSASAMLDRRDYDKKRKAA